MAASGPTTMTRSPICKVSDGVAKKSTPALLIRVMLMPYVLRSCNEPSVLPLTASLVTRIRLETRLDSSLYQSIWTSFPRKARTLVRLVVSVATKTKSFSSRMVSELVSVMTPSCFLMREITKFSSSKPVTN
ncbi:MAG: hypothetical protein BWY72_01256 [Bacteroidetes bacterium ADurb.Bin416]|nr:MAG: hypothetical protein BWY72_01256 [Bacteroidetes bacterium ADurb.Bin416]